MAVVEERGKPEYPEKNLSGEGREPTTNSTHILCLVQESKPGHIVGRRVLSSLYECFRYGRRKGTHIKSIQLIKFFTLDN